MADEAPQIAVPALPQDHVPSIPSPLNPHPDSKPSKPKPPPREREPRERKESQKKRESTLGGKETISTVPSKRKASSSGPSVPSPIRYANLQARPSDFVPPRPTTFASHEPFPFLTPDGETELKKPLDRAANAKGYRYVECIADPLFSHKQYYRSTDAEPCVSRMSFEDADKWVHFHESGRLVTNEKGWRGVRGNMCAREGRFYFEVRIVRGVKPDEAEGDGDGPQPRVRVGWGRREAPLDAPVGFDGFSYGITDRRFEPIHRSRASKFWNDKKGAKKGARAEKGFVDQQPDLCEGDVLGLELTLPSFSLHRKVVDGVYNPAVDRDDTGPPRIDPTETPHDVIRDRIPVPYKGHLFFESQDLWNETAPMKAYSDRTLALANLGSPVQIPGANTAIKTAPNPNHPEPALRTLPGSSIKVYRNGDLVGTAFDHLLAFLPPASVPNKAAGAREGFDDGMIGYFPFVTCFSGGIAEVNFGDDGFWCAPEHVRRTGEDSGDGIATRPLGERFREQIVEDIVWDLVDEVDFFMQDGGFGGRAGAGGGEVKTGEGRLKEEVD